MAHGQEYEYYSSPFFLPDGYHFLEYIRSPRKETRGIYVASLDGTVKRQLLAIDSNAVYAPSLSGDRQMGYLLFLREGALLAQPFDTRQMKLTGEPLPIAEQVGRDAGYWNEFRGNFSVSDDGLLVYDSSVNRRSKQLVWVDRQGKLIRSLGAAGGYTPPCLSPDEKRVVVDRFNDQTGFYDLWLYDVEGGGPPNSPSIQPSTTFRSGRPMEGALSGYRIEKGRKTFIGKHPAALAKTSFCLSRVILIQ
jgi:hypothetical protein